ncbi:reticulon-like protein B13 isoform X1 [Nicotiana tomentosiformis]|uniref:reticulon-like protein B13 isoform X1 n=1 Tax=Nicotiana tomentosiformis TaxID=4098 RepID=UPI00051AD779|nr:reticulon-like protein B13 isoform X1 [Nicotiana tomentosiformis]
MQTSTDSPPTREIGNDSASNMHTTSTEFPTPSPTRDVSNGTDIVRDVILWKRKNLSVLTLLAATAIWLALEVYELKFVTLFSWMSMLAVAFLLFWGNIHRLLGKEPVDMSAMYISEKSAREMGAKIQEYVEKSLRLVFSVSAEKEWLVFAGTVASLGLISVVASYFDLLTLLYFGVVVGLTGPFVYVKYEHKIKEWGQKVRVRYQRCYATVVQKLQEMKNKMQEKKRKKME